MKTIFGQQTTKVKQLADLISQDISMGRYKTDTALPSINQLSHDYKVSRDTVFKAFIDLKERGIIDSTPGKGYYVVNRQKNILLLLDEYSPFKDTLYNSIIRRLSTRYKVDLWFHQYNEALFNAILPRTTGFASVNPADFQPSTILLVCLLMWIGGSSQSMAGGVKVNTVAVLFLNLKGIITGSDQTGAFHRAISEKAVLRAYAVAFIATVCVFVFSFIT